MLDRDELAKTAMQGILAGCSVSDPAEVASWAYELADQMIEHAKEHKILRLTPGDQDTLTKALDYLSNDHEFGKKIGHSVWEHVYEIQKRVKQL